MFEKKNNLKGWLYLAPTLILMAVFTFWPLINTFAISFLENYEGVYGEYDAIGLMNYRKIAQAIPLIGQWFSGGKVQVLPKNYKYIFTNTFIIVFVTVPISTILSLLIAVLLNSIKKFQKIFQTVFFLPYVTNSIAIGMVFATLFNNKYGVVNYLIDLCGGDPITWFGISSSRFHNLLVLCIYIIWNSLAFKILLFLSGLQSIDKQYYQAAQIDSAPKWKVFLRITTPLLSPQIFYVLITSFIGAFKEYSSVVGLFGDDAVDGQVGTVVWYVYQYIDTQTGAAAAACIILFIFIMIFTAINMYVSKKRVHY